MVGIPTLGRTGSPPTVPVDDGLTPDLLAQLRDVVTSMFLKTMAVTGLTGQQSVVMFLAHIQLERKFHTLFSDHNQSVEFFERELHSLSDTSTNELRLTFLLRFHTYVMANWSGTNQHYDALLKRMAFAFGSEVVESNYRQFSATMLPMDVVERLSTPQQVESVLKQNRALAAIAMFMLYMDYVEWHKFVVVQEPKK